jgi:hypothetical protein
LKRIHDKTRNYDSETEQRLSNVHKLRKLKEAIKKRESAAKFQSFQDQLVYQLIRIKHHYEMKKLKIPH